MDRRVGAYLHAPAGPARSCGPVSGANDNVVKQSLFIMETRESYWLAPVIRNAIQEFPNWDLFVCGPAPVLDAVLSEFPGVKAICIDAPAKSSPETFSAVMFSSQIWEVFDTEFVMIFQTDSVFSKDASTKIPDGSKDYYGAACGDVSSDKFVINGGLSYRRVKAFAKAALLLTEDDRKIAEDIAFCNVMRRHPTEFALPTMKECMSYAIESFGNPTTAFGMHGTDKQYAPPALIAALLPPPKKRYIVDCFTYDGEPILETRLKLLDSTVDRFIIVEALFTHSGEPKEPMYDPSKFEAWKDKITYLVADFPPMPPGWGADFPWVKGNAEAWWREKCQRDEIVKGFHGVPDDALVIISDVDEIPDMARVVDLVPPPDHAIHLDMAFLVHQPTWQRNEAWSRAYACSPKFVNEHGATTIRTSTPVRVLQKAGWHCSSFFGVDRQIQKIKSFAHREFSKEIDPVIVKHRLDNGKDPYGRGAEYDCHRTMEHAWLCFL